MNSKKRTIADVKAGRIYRCANCDAKCNDDHVMTSYSPEACYLGRMDVSKAIHRYYCSTSCYKHAYLDETLPVIEGFLQQRKKALLQEKELYTKCLSRRDLDPCCFKIPEHVARLEEHKHSLFHLTHTIKFLEACIARKSEYELHTLQLKALHTFGPVLEDCHEDEKWMDSVLHSRMIFENLDTSILCYLIKTKK